MAQSLSKVYIHTVFSTKHVKNLITEKIREELQSYIIGCLSNIGSYTEEIYINPDHLHALCTLPRTVTIAQLITKIKTPSSRWLKTKGISDFDWQDGYAAFSVSASNLDALRNYILNQPDHHKKVNYKDELRIFFKKYNIDFALPTASLRRPKDEKYVWD